MAMLDKGLKQRMVGALVLLALAVIFLPMLFSREDETRQVVVEPPPQPVAPPMPPVEVQPTEVPQLREEEPETVDVAQPSLPAGLDAEPAETETPSPRTPPSRLDADQLPISWSVQIASLADRQRAEALQKKLREQGYNAYVRRFENKNRVLVGPVLERAQADQIRKELNRLYKLDGFVVRFQPERH